MFVLESYLWIYFEVVHCTNSGNLDVWCKVVSRRVIQIYQTDKQTDAGELHTLQPSPSAWVIRNKLTHRVDSSCEIVVRFSCSSSLPFNWCSDVWCWISLLKLTIAVHSCSPMEIVYWYQCTKLSHVFAVSVWCIISAVVYTSVNGTELLHWNSISVALFSQCNTLCWFQCISQIHCP